MTVVRPSNRMDVEIGAEMSLEQQVLGQLTLLNAKVTTIQHGQDLFRKELMGDVAGDTPHGRLPRVERETSDHETRLGSLENDRIRWKAYAAASAFIGGLAGAAITSLSHLVSMFAK